MKEFGACFSRSGDTKCTNGQELADAHHQLREKVTEYTSYMAFLFNFIVLTAGNRANKKRSRAYKKKNRADKKGSRADKGRGDYQERAGTDSGDETQS